MINLSISHPHYSALECWIYLLRFEIGSRTKRLNEVVEVLSSNDSRVLYVGRRNEEGYFCLITNRWEECLMDRFDGDGDPNYRVVNGVERFDGGGKFLMYGDDADSSLHTDDSDIAYPAVFYSRIEVFGWFVLGLFIEKKGKEESLSEFFKTFNVKDKFSYPLSSLRDKLCGLRTWDYGPARKFEANREAWHQKAGDKSNNLDILRFIDELLLSF